MEENHSYKNEERKLIEDFLNEDGKAIRLFFEKYGGIIKHAILSVDLKGVMMDYDDLFNEAVTYILQDKMHVIRIFKGECKLSTYLYTICRRFAVSKVIPEGCYAKNISSIPSEELPDSFCEEMEIFSTQYKEALSNAINECDKDTKIFIQMMFYHNRSTTEIIESFGWGSENTVYSKKNKVINKLKKNIRKQLLQKELL